MIVEFHRTLIKYANKVCYQLANLTEFLLHCNYIISLFFPTTDMTVKSTNQRSESVPSRRSLRICCYGSSSSKTPSRYLTEAYELGSTLAKRGHICVNGAGPHGCMASLNDGASDAGGHIVGVIHKMFAIDGAGAHPVFSDKSKESVELIYAGGEDLQERKKLLVKGADALVVLPGGPGTWDEVRFFQKKVAYKVDDFASSYVSL